jgi:hypothetical protein
VVDASRTQTEAHFGFGLMRGSTGVTRNDYFSGVNVLRVYRYNTTGLTFVEVVGGAQLLVGDGLWVNIQPNADGSISPIAP